MATIKSATEIRPFHVDVPDEELADLRRRIGAPPSTAEDIRKSRRGAEGPQKGETR